MSTVNNITSSASTSSTNSTDTISNSTELNKDDFLKLLITQLKNQDPMSPMDDSQFVSQMAQFSSLEQMSNVATAISDLKESMVKLNSQSLLTQGAAMIGKNVVGTDSEGTEITGTISSVKWLDDSLTLMIGDTPLTMDNISEIKD